MCMTPRLPSLPPLLQLHEDTRMVLATAEHLTADHYLQARLTPSAAPGPPPPAATTHV